jgi:putative heme transporter
VDHAPAHPPGVVQHPEAPGVVQHPEAPGVVQHPEAPGVVQPTDAPGVLAHARHPGLVTWGLRAWLTLGLVLLAVAVTSFLAQVSGLVVPLVVATVIGALLVPAVDRLHQGGLPRQLGAVLMLLGLVATVLGSLWLVLAGVVGQGGQVQTRLLAGLEAVEDWLADRGVDLGGAESLTTQLTQLAGESWGGVASYLPGVFSSLASFLLGSVIGAFLFFYILVDWHRLTAWLGGHLGLGPQDGAGVIDDAVSSIRQYFGSLTLSALLTAVLIGGAAWLLDVPLALTIAVVTLVTSYIPYLGAILSGAFAVLVALGSTDLQTTLVLLVVVLVVQNIVQTVVLTKLTSDALSLHPIVTLGSTIVGAALAGALGATLAAPVVAMTLRVRARLVGDAAPDPAAAVQDAGSDVSG